ncbi:MAG: CvpA family protein, partial [Dorea sp.]|nr:CvpA family protein [Dorea sp.]
MKTTKKVTIALVLVILAGLYYYVSLPAINIHSSDTWFFILGLVVVILAWYIIRKRMNIQEIKDSKVAKWLIRLLLLIGAVYVIGSILSSPIVNAKKYQKLMKVKEGNFTDDVEQISFDKVPLLDKDTAEILGDRKMGSMVEMVSQF